MQYNTVNTFVYANINKPIFIHIPPGYSKNGKIFYLNKALYSLQWFSLLWQQKLLNKLKMLDFKEIPQKFYMI